MPALFDDIDYRKILREHYHRRKEAMPLYSYRMMGQKLGVDGSHLFRILQGINHLPVRCVPAAKELLELSGRSAEYFDLLVAAGRTVKQSKKEELLKKAYALRDVERTALDSSEMKFLSNWYIPVIWSYLEVSEGKINLKEIAARLVPSITIKEVEEALEILKNLGFVRKLSSEKYGLFQSHLTISGQEKAAAIRKFQLQNLQHAMESIERFLPEDRDISTLTIAVDANCFADLREMSREFRRQVQKRVEECATPDRVLQLNLSLFPRVAARKIRR